MLYAEDFRRIAREALNGKWALAVGTGFVAALLGGTSRGGGSSNGGSNNYNSGGVDRFFDSEFSGLLIAFIIGIMGVIMLYALVIFFLGGAIELGYCRFNLNLINGTDPRFGDLFSRFDIFWKALGLRIVKAIFIFLWTLLFIIPGIIAAYRYSMATYIMAENPNMGIMEAIDHSKAMMNGNKWRLFCLQISFIGWAILCIFTCGIGFLWLAPYVSAATAAFYNEVSGKNLSRMAQVSGPNNTPMSGPSQY